MAQSLNCTKIIRLCFTVVILNNYIYNQLTARKEDYKVRDKIKATFPKYVRSSLHLKSVKKELNSCETCNLPDSIYL